MKLQLALDRVDLSGILSVLHEIGDLVDIVEIGTPVIIREGVRAVAETKRAFPKMEVLADLKIMDAGEYEASIGFDAGADIVTVLGAAHDATVLGAIRQARARSRRVMVDMIAVRTCRPGRARWTRWAPASSASIRRPTSTGPDMTPCGTWRQWPLCSTGPPSPWPVASSPARCLA